MEKYMYIVCPVRRVPGFTQSKCETYESAQRYAFDMEWQTGVRWKIYRKVPFPVGHYVKLIKK